MDEYIVQYICSDGTEGEEAIFATNSIMAIEIFKEFNYPNVISINCHRSHLLEEILERVTSIFDIAYENAESEKIKKYILETENALHNYLVEHGRLI